MQQSGEFSQRPRISRPQSQRALERSEGRTLVESTCLAGLCEERLAERPGRRDPHHRRQLGDGFIPPMLIHQRFAE